jgi:hypothetical protein
MHLGPKDLCMSPPALHSPYHLLGVPAVYLRGTVVTEAGEKYIALTGYGTGESNVTHGTKVPIPIDLLPVCCS